MSRSSVDPIEEVVATALGQVHRDDPVLPRTGGPAGNATLTAWLGLGLLVLFVVECVTLLSLRPLINVHIIIGTVLVALVLAKTGVTGWRIVRYYLGDPAYRQAGPPPLLLRLLGPLVVLTGLAVLGTGLALIPLGSGTYTSILTVGGQRIDALTLHKLAFVAWLVVVGAHTLLRTIPALRLIAGRAGNRFVPGRLGRSAVIAGTMAIGIVAAIIVVDYSGNWTSGSVSRQQFDGPEGDH